MDPFPLTDTNQFAQATCLLNTHSIRERNMVRSCCKLSTYVYLDRLSGRNKTGSKTRYTTLTPSH
ncbi:hypothetical protein OUZ56_021898 [Daphnia magna]|uniref:Uncharacterized protein n=1 Tax=Daphnia magna TaxID=35525 RepID=A0ABR0AUS5_9CRUS|nr:hypothetical protein OUZ56_021898 [Daphnia magna]